MAAPKDDSNCNKVRFGLRFPPALLEVMEITKGDFYSSKGTALTTGSIDNLLGTIGTSEWSLNSPSATATGNGIIAQVRFKLRGRGTGDIMLQSSKIIGASGTTVDASPTNGRCKVLSMLEDVNQDGVIDILDLVVVGKAFGSTPGNPGWDSLANVKSDDQVIDIFDLVMVAKIFGAVSP